MTAARDAVRSPARPAAPPHGRVRVAQVGLLGEEPGGMAQVVNEYLRWSSADMTQTGVLSARRRRDPTAPLLAVTAALTLLRFRMGGRAGSRPVVVVHLSEGGSFVREGALLAWSRLLGMPAVAHLHGAEFEAFSTAHPRLVAAVLRRASAVAVLTEQSATVVRRLVPHRTPVLLVPNVVPTAERPLRSDPVVVFGGEVSHRKGADVLIAAWDRIEQRFPEWSLQIAGPVPRTSPLPESLPARAELLGAVPHEELLDRLAVAAVAVLPSRNEALPMFLLEAMAHGCAVVGTDVGQVAGLLGDGAGVVVPSGDADVLASALEGVLSSPDQRQRLADAGLERFRERYSVDRARQVLLDFWSGVARA